MDQLFVFLTSWKYHFFSHMPICLRRGTCAQSAISFFRNDFLYLIFLRSFHFYSSYSFFLFHQIRKQGALIDFRNIFFQNNLINVKVKSPRGRSWIAFSSGTLGPIGSFTTTFNPFNQVRFSDICNIGTITDFTFVNTQCIQ